MRARGALSLFLLVLSLAPPAVAGDASVELGSLEKEAVDDALAARGLLRDLAPAGKSIGAIHIVNQDVFSRRDGFLPWFNIFHRTTRENAVRREVLTRPGQVYDPLLVEETVRNLQDPSLSNIVVIVPVLAPLPGQVDLLVVTRDVWSLRFNSNFEYQAGRLIYFTGSLSENNLFGWRKQVAAVFVMDQGAMAAGPTYNDPNVGGTRLRLSASARAIFARETGVHEGSSSNVSLTYPLFSLASRWGASLAFGHVDDVARRFVANSVRTVDLKGTPEVEALPWVYRFRSVGTSAGATRSFGSRVIQRLSAGHSFSVTRPTFADGFPEDSTTRELFRAQIFPRSERVSSLFVGYRLFTPRYRIYRDFDTYDLPENFILGPNLGASASRAIEALGSERAFSTASASVAWSADLRGGFQSASAAWGGRLQDGQLVDESVSAQAYLGTPILGRLRIVASGETAYLFRYTQNALLTLGGANGLRGYAVGEFTGHAQVIGHLELRSLAVKVASLRLGALLFYDLGHAADSPDYLVAHQDAGLGLRLLIPQFNTYVLRVDWAVPFQNGNQTPAGLPGRISAGFAQIF